MLYFFLSSTCSAPILLAQEGANNFFLHLWQGLMIGLWIAIPVGPIAFLCMQYALHRGFNIAFMAGLGAAIADTCFGILACLGLTLLSEWLTVNSCWLQFCGGLFLCLLGSYLYFTHKENPTSVNQDVTPLAVFSSTFLLTLANPLTVLAFIALFSYFGLSNMTHQLKYAVATILGIFLGSLSWWTLLIYGMTRLRPYFTTHTLMRFRQVGGIALFAFGIVAMLRSW